MNPIGKYADANPPTNGAALKAAGFSGVFGYVGTPGWQKSTTRAKYLDWIGHGLAFAGIYENLATDIDGGFAAGVAHANDAINDMLAMGMPNTTPVGVAVDEHLTAAQLNLALQYQQGFTQQVLARGWLGPIGAYGFSEFLIPVHFRHYADWFWLCGSISTYQPWMHFWQDNTGIDTVAGSQTDRDWQYLPMPVKGQQPQLAVTAESGDIMITAPAGTNEHVNLVVPATGAIYLATSYADKLTVHQIDFFGPTDPAKVATGNGVGGGKGEVIVLPNDPGPVATVPAGAVMCAIRYTASHPFAVGVR